MTDARFFYRPQMKLRQHSNRNFLFGLFVIIFLLILLVWQRITVIRILKETEDLKILLAAEEKKYKYLNLERTGLSSIERIEKIAQEKLGLIYPGREQIVYVDVEKINRPDLPGNLWVKLKKIGRKINPFMESGVQAKEIKHDL
ncbi:MAG: cell division protein FtsL [candidate division Zixibacteria bacterium]|nr:cell division protein FtsL [candidate division Zixibacteria bacterium]